MKFILWFIIGLLVIRMLRKSIFVSVYRSYNQQMKAQMQKEDHHKKPEGTITIEKKKPQNIKGNRAGEGDYVDYEEVK